MIPVKLVEMASLPILQRLERMRRAEKKKPSSNVIHKNRNSQANSRSSREEHRFAPAELPLLHFPQISENLRCLGWTETQN